MDSYPRTRRLALAVVLVGFVGCGSSSGEAPSADVSKVRMMSGFYEGYLADHRSKPPTNEQAFREYLNTKGDMLQQVGLSVDQMFVSPRSEKPLKWVYGQKPPVWRPNGMTCYAYEAEPVAGKRLVIGGRGMVAEVDESQFKSLFPKAS